MSLSFVGNDTFYPEGKYRQWSEPFNANCNGYEKTGYWGGYEYLTENSSPGASYTMLLSIKLGENTNPDTNLNLFRNCLTE